MIDKLVQVYDPFNAAKPMNDGERLLTTGQVARRMALRPRGIEGLVQQGKLSAYKVSQRIVRFRGPEVLQDLSRFKFKAN